MKALSIIKGLRVLFVAGATCMSCTRTPNTKSCRYSEPFEIASLSNKPGWHAMTETTLSVLDAHGAAIPFALLTLQWPDGGKVGFQTDRDGRIDIRLEESLLDKGVDV